MRNKNRITRRSFLEKSASITGITTLGISNIYGMEKVLTDTPRLAKSVINHKNIDQLPSGFKSIVNDTLLMDVAFGILIGMELC